MKIIILLFAILFVGSSLPQPAFADQCTNRARQELAAYPGGKLLSVQSVQKANGATVCKVRIKLKASNGKPGRVVMRSFNLS